MEDLFRTAFKWLLRGRWIIITLFLALLVPAAWFAAHIEVDNSTDSLLVQTDPAIKDWELLKHRFGSDEFILVGFAADDLFKPEFLATIDEIENKLAKTPHLVHSRSLISIYRQIKPLFNPHDKHDCKELENFVGTSEFFQDQGMIATDKLFSLILQLKFQTPVQRIEVVDFVNQVLKSYEEAEQSPFSDIKKTGQPYISYELDHYSVQIGATFLPLYLLFSAFLIFYLYRSFRGAFAILIVFGVVVAMSVAVVHLLGSKLSMLTNILPIMVMIISLETMMHLYSGYVWQPEGRNIRDHFIDVLSNKVVACFMAVFTTMVGFASFSISNIRPIHELGIYVTIGLFLSFLVSITLFPVLLDWFKPPTRQKKQAIGFRFVDPLFDFLPGFTYRQRIPILLVAGLLTALGIWSFINTQMETNTIKYLSNNSKARKDSEYVEKNLIGLSSLEVMLEGEKGQFSKPENLRNIYRFEEKLLKRKHIQGTLSVSTLIRTANHIANGEDTFPKSNFRLFPLLASLSQREVWNTYVTKDFDVLRVSVISKMVDFQTFMTIKASFEEEWQAFAKEHPEFQNVKYVITGTAPMLAKVNIYMTDTLTSSFGMTMVIVFVLFLIQLRSLKLSLLAMIPSLFAIFLMFGLMKAGQLTFDIGTILLATIVLGISVDATIHFFYHYLEKRRGEETDVEEALGHTLKITGRALVLATLTIFFGFLIFALSDFPPLRQFGLLVGSAIVFGLIGDLIVLPAFIWLTDFRKNS